MAPAPSPAGLDAIEALVTAQGLVMRGAFHPGVADDVPPLSDGQPCGTLVLFGFVGRRGFDRFALSTEARDGLPDPLDRWSLRVIGAIAEACGGVPLFPFGGPPHHPFQRWARRAEDVHPSPIGLLVHPRWGLWHSYRGAVALPARLDLAALPPRAGHPCKTCVGRPCLSACPVGAFTGNGYDVDACVAHVSADPDGTCKTNGCLARGACPIGQDGAPSAAQAAFTMRAFLRARPAPR
ncbi:ferredoxin [Alsobacter sp. R-9]